MTTLSRDQRERMYGCPPWCHEYHDHRETMLGSAVHAATVLRERGGGFVGLTQVNDDPPHVVCDPGPVKQLTPQQARRFATAVLIALDRLDEGNA